MNLWSNNNCDMFDIIKNDLAEFFPDYGEEELAEISDDTIWDMAYEEIVNDLDCLKSNLDKEVDGNLILVGTLQRWNGAFSASKDLNTSNIGEAISVALGAFDGDNTFNIDLEDGKLLIKQWGHDNPTSPSEFEFVEVDEDNPKDMKSIGSYVNQVYGWEE